MTGGTLGTLVYDRLIVGETGGGTGSNQRLATGAESRGNHEWILKPNSKYLLSLVNTAGSARDFNIEFDFYEE